MPYSKFTLSEVLKQFGLTLIDRVELFPEVKPVAPSPFLQMALTEWGELALDINSEKARSEFIIAPLLAELRRLPAVSLFSGINFDVDPERGLDGYCDFLLSRSPQQLFIEALVFAIVEAKNEDIKSGFGQCIASMIGAQLFNARSSEQAITVYGAMTTGTNWRFLKLEKTTVSLDRDEEFWNPVDRLLGILTAIVAPE